MKALVTGFEPFGGDSINPSFEALALLRRQNHWPTRRPFLPTEEDLARPRDPNHFFSFFLNEWERSNRWGHKGFLPQVRDHDNNLYPSPD